SFAPRTTRACPPATLTIARPSSAVKRRKSVAESLFLEASCWRARETLAKKAQAKHIASAKMLLLLPILQFACGINQTPPALLRTCILLIESTLRLGRAMELAVSVIAQMGSGPKIVGSSRWLGMGNSLDDAGAVKVASLAALF